jgi:hypothetical protein
MKTIKIISRDKTVPLPWSNPFAVYSVENRVISDSGSVRTGLKIELPLGTDMKAEQSRSDMCPTNCFLMNGELVISFIPCGGGESFVEVKPGEHIANIRIIKMENEGVRFIDFSEGKRMIVGDAQKPNIAKSSTVDDFSINKGEDNE